MKRDPFRRALAFTSWPGCHCRLCRNYGRDKVIDRRRARRMLKRMEP